MSNAEREIIKLRLQALYQELTGQPKFIPFRDLPKVQQKETWLREQIRRLEQQLLAIPDETQREVQAGTEERKPADGIVFERVGSGWRVIADGKDVWVAGLRGIEILSKLVTRPGVPIPTAELLGEGSIKDGPRQIVTDPEALADIRRRYHDLEDGIAEAERRGDVTEAEVMRRELEMLRDRVRTDTRPNGKARTFASAMDRTRSRIGHSLRRAYDKLREAGVPQLASRLESAVEPRGDGYVYLP